MSESFAEATRRWNALAARWLGWRPADFWPATPAELTASLADPDGTGAIAPPTRDVIARMMERDTDARQV
jgi:hypothetical protein